MTLPKPYYQDDYSKFLQSKICLAQSTGFNVDISEINPILKPHQKDIVMWDLKGGRCANFASFGLGKTFIQLEVLRLIQKHFSGRQLIIAPLGVRYEFLSQSEVLNVPLAFVRKSEEISKNGIYITNYESVRDGKLDVNLFNGVSLDEASVLRSFGSKTYQSFLDLFKSVKFKFVNTATPAPNEFKELIHYAGYLGVMDTGQALTRFFKRDSTKAGNLQLHPHMEKEFWLWVSSWGIFINKPSDLGYDDTGYDLPKLHIHECMVKTKLSITFQKDGQASFLPNTALWLKEAAQEKRDTIDLRVDKAKEIMQSKPD